MLSTLLVVLSASVPLQSQHHPPVEAAQEGLALEAAAQSGRGGWLGVTLNESGSGDEPQLTITDVTEGSAAARAGLRARDRILRLNDRPAGGYSDFAAKVQGLGPGTRVQVTIERELEARLGDEAGQPRLGVTLGGASASSVSKGSAAEQAGVLAGDVIVAVGGEECTSADDVIAAIRSNQPGEVVGVTLRRVVPVVLGSRSGASDAVPQPRPEVRRDARPAPEAAEAQRRDAETAERQAQVSQLQAQVRELSGALDRLRRELDELQRDLDRLR